MRLPLRPSMKKLKLLLLLFAMPAIMHAQSRLMFIEKGSEWKYFDKAEYPGDGWMKKNFNDGQWSIGKAELGYGDGDEKTVINHGTDSDAKHLTAYFRKTFD